MPSEMPITGGSFTLLDQIRNEYQEGQDAQRPKKLRWVRQLVLMNNLNRGDQNIASTTLFSYFYRVLSNLYSDALQVMKFIGSEDSDQKKTEALIKLYRNDIREMDKDKWGYTWLWDACFFGRGYLETIKWNFEKKLLEPHVINPLVFVHDPHSDNPYDWRYYGKWVTKSAHDINKLVKKGLIKEIKSAKELPSGVEPEIWEYKVRRDTAKDINTQLPSPDSSSANQIYQILDFYTYDENGNKVNVWVDKNFNMILKQEILDLNDGDDGESRWPIVIKEVFKEAHSSVAISIPDIIEDKHRALNILENLILISAKDETNPLYLFNPDKVKDSSQLFQRNITQHIPVSDVNDSVAPVKKNTSLTASIIGFINMLKGESAEAIGTAQIPPQEKKGKKSATEAALAQQLADLSQSLQAKLIMHAEREFVSHWYHRYLRYTTDADKKLVAITSTPTITYESISLGSNIKTKFPPRIEMFSSKEAEFKEQMKRRDYMQLFPVFAKTMDEKSLKMFLREEFFPKFGIESATVERIIPKSLEDIKAEQENELLNMNEFVEVKESDDDESHLYKHLGARHTPAMWAHYFAHEEQLAQKKEKEKAMAMSEKSGGEEGQLGGQGASPKAKPATTTQATAPLAGLLENQMGGKMTPALAK